MTRNHALEIADARIAADMAQIEAIEAAVSRETLIPDTADADPLNVRFADDVHDGRGIEWIPGDAIICLDHDNRPPLLRRLVWPGVALCALGLALMGVGV